jgi:hypothetical protein
MLYATAFLAFDVLTGLWSLPRSYVRLAQCGRVGLVRKGCILGLPSSVGKHMLLLKATVEDPQLGKCMALRDEYRALHFVFPVPSLYHKDVLVYMDEKRKVTHVLVFFTKGHPLASLDDLAINFTCLVKSIYQGNLSRRLYLEQLHSVGVLKRIDASTATEDERTAAKSLLHLLEN